MLLGIWQILPGGFDGAAALAPRRDFGGFGVVGDGRGGFAAARGDDGRGGGRGGVGFSFHPFFLGRGLRWREFEDLWVFFHCRKKNPTPGTGIPCRDP